MKFHIFASRDGKEKFKIKDDRATNPDSYIDCLEDYEDLVSISAYTDIYFLCDFGLYKEKPLEYASIDDKDKLPFLVLDEWHINTDDKICSNKTSIVTDGFKEEFRNAKVAMSNFLYYIDNKIQAVLEYNNTYVADTAAILSSDYNIKRYKLRVEP